jgi:hypothetical protein
LIGAQQQVGVGGQGAMVVTIATLGGLRASFNSATSSLHCVFPFSQTPATLLNDTHAFCLSTTAALAWLECYAIQQTHQQGHRHVCIPPDRILCNIFEEEKDKKMEEEDKSDNDDSDYDPNKNEDK